jgi:hypothetical protein
MNLDELQNIKHQYRHLQLDRQRHIKQNPEHPTIHPFIQQPHPNQAIHIANLPTTFSAPISS